MTVLAIITAIGIMAAYAFVHAVREERRDAEYRKDIRALYGGGE